MNRCELVRCIEEVMESYIVDRIAGRITKAKRVFIVGNGGSASVATHFACDLRNRAGIDAWSLTSNHAVITAIANDAGYQFVFSDQIVEYCERGDMVILFSVSGASPNTILAANAARDKGVTVAAFVGKSFSSFENVIDLGLAIGTADFGVAETCFAAIAHHITDIVRGES